MIQILIALPNRQRQCGLLYFVVALSPSRWSATATSRRQRFVAVNLLYRLWLCWHLQKWTRFGMFRNVIHGSDALTFTSSCIFHDPDNSFSFLYCSNVFNEVEVNSYQIWKYQYYYLVMEYSKQPPLAPPFAILYHIVEFARWLGKKCGKNKVSRKYST